MSIYSLSPVPKLEPSVKTKYATQFAEMWEQMKTCDVTTNDPIDAEKNLYRLVFDNLTVELNQIDRQGSFNLCKVIGAK